MWKYFGILIEAGKNIFPKRCGGGRKNCPKNRDVLASCTALMSSEVLVNIGTATSKLRPCQWWTCRW
jgi:hypothetical protein